MDEHDEGLHSGRFSIIPASVFDDPRITPTLLRLLGVLGTHGNKHGYCWPKLTTLAGRMGNVSSSAISQNLKKLHELGYLEITPRYDKDGGRSTNMYRILFDSTPPELKGGLAPELKGGLAPELKGGLAPELNTLNVPSERPKLTLPTAAAATTFAREPKRGDAAAAAVVVENDELRETAEACLRHLRMGRDKLDGLTLIVRMYPNRRPWLENEANLCFSTLRVRPLELKHFSNWLQSSEIRRKAQEAKEEASHETATATAAAGTTEPSGSSQRRPQPQTERTLTGHAGAAAIWNAVLANLQKTDGGGADTLPPVSRHDE